MFPPGGFRCLTAFLVALVVEMGEAKAVTLGGAEVAREDFVFFIIIGHSNTAYTPGSDQDTHPRVWAYKNDSWIPAAAPLNQITYGDDWCGPGMSLGKRLAELYPDKHIGIISHGVKNAPKARHYWQGAVFKERNFGNETIAMAKAAQLDAIPGGVITMFSWGESRSTGEAESFLEDYQRLVNEFRSELNNDSLPFLNETFYTNAPARLDAAAYPGWQTVRDQIPLLPDNITSMGIVDHSPPASAFEWDYWKMHFDVEHQTLWGQRAAEIIHANEWFPAVAPDPIATPPIISKQPSNTTVSEGSSASFSVQVSGTSPFAYQWQKNETDIAGATGATLQLTSVSLADDGSTFRCLVSNEAGDATSASATLWVVAQQDPIVNAAPTVSAGASQSASLGVSIALKGVVEDDGLPDRALTIAWSKVDGPGNVSFDSPGTAETTAAFAEVGVYTLRLSADDGELDAHDDISVTVVEEATLVLDSPNGGESWPVGSVQTIRWSAVGIDDVTVRFSSDEGLSWETVAWTVDTSSEHWGALPWTVPDTPSAGCLIALSAYIATAGGETRSAAPFEIVQPSDRPASGQTAIVGTGCSSATTPVYAAVAVFVVVIFARRRRRRGTAYSPIQSR